MCHLLSELDIINSKEPYQYLQYLIVTPPLRQHFKRPHAETNNGAHTSHSEKVELSVSLIVL